jgi:hypothetical protein
VDARTDGSPQDVGDDSVGLAADADARGAEGPGVIDRAEGAVDSSRPGALGGFRALAGEDFSFADAIGGGRGLVESAAPGLVFVVVYLLDHRLAQSLIAAGSVALVALGARLVQRTPVTQAFSGLLGVGVGVLWAWGTGRAQDYFAGGLILNAVWFVGISASLAARWPVVGVIVSLLRGEDWSWRTSPAADHERRRFVWASWLWLVMFGLRLGVQLPLYLRGEDAVGWLGTARLVMGLPLFAVTLWITWLLVGSRAAREDRQDPPPNPRR